MAKSTSATDEKSIALAMIVIALGQLALEETIGDKVSLDADLGQQYDHPPGLTCFNEARKRLGLVDSGCSLEVVQLQALISSVFVTARTGRRQTNFTVIGFVTLLPTTIWYAFPLAMNGILVWRCSKTFFSGILEDEYAGIRDVLPACEKVVILQIRSRDKNQADKVRSASVMIGIHRKVIF
jgi:hypothetical protein